MSSMAHAWTSVSAGVSAKAGAVPKISADTAALGQHQAEMSTYLAHYHVLIPCFCL